LAVCHSIVTGHGGVITVDSRLGRGTVFTVYLPASSASDVDAPAPAAGIVPGRGRILIMDDEDSVRQVASKMIALLGYESAGARDGNEAIAMWQRARAESNPFDLAIMDLTVPGGLGGREATRRLLELDPGAKVVVSSGYSDDPVMASYREHGFGDVLAKPYRVADVSRVLAALLR
jgi:CheY-like chemotaxis protein